MRTDRLLVSTILLIAGNLLPLGGVLFFDWSVYHVLLLFWAENLVIGLFTLARFWTLYRREGEGAVLLYMPFFCLHYGLFTLAHGAFVVSLFRPEHAAGLDVGTLGVPLLALFISHGGSYVMNFLGNREYRESTPKEVMVAPYRRVVALHMTIIAGGVLVQWLGEPVYALALLVVLKIFLDVAAHRKSHREKKQAEAGRAAGTEGRRDAGVFRPWD